MSLAVSAAYRAWCMGVHGGVDDSCEWPSVETDTVAIASTCGVGRLQWLADGCESIAPLTVLRRLELRNNGSD